MHHVLMSTLCVKIKFEIDINKDELLQKHMKIYEGNKKHRKKGGGRDFAHFETLLKDYI